MGSRFHYPQRFHYRYQLNKVSKFQFFFCNSDLKKRTLEIRRSDSETSPGDNGLLSKVKRCKRKKTEHGWFLSILTIFQNEVFETILKFIVDEEVVDKPLLLGGCLGLHHDGESGAVVLERKY